MTLSTRSANKNKAKDTPVSTPNKRQKSSTAAKPSSTDDGGNSSTMQEVTPLPATASETPDDVIAFEQAVTVNEKDDEVSPDIKGASVHRFGDTADIKVRKCPHSMLSRLI